MEIEAKFRVPNRDAHRQLLRLSSIAGYTIARVGRVEVHDRYFDTSDGQLMAADYFCRLRTQPDKVVATLKGLGSSQDGVHRRAELEVTLPSLLLDPADWPESEARTLALDLTQGAPLQPLFELHQLRYKADLMDGSRRVGEWSLDEVRAAVGKRPAFYYELEIELGPDGAESDLERVAQVLQGEHGLEPEPSSKFARGLEMLRLRGTAIEGSITDEERKQLSAYGEGSDSELARRAGAVLAWAGGLPTREIVERTRLSAGRVRFWLREFRAKRMGIFASDDESSPPPDAPVVVPARSRRVRDASASSDKTAPADIIQPNQTKRTEVSQTGSQVDQPDARIGAANAESDKKARRAAKVGLPTVADFARLHGVNSAHARRVAEHALTLFDALRKVHDLPRKRRRLLRAAALLATVGAAQDQEQPARAGRDLILAQPLHGISTEDRLALACIVALQRGKLKPGKEPALEALEPKQRKDVIALACLLRLGSALSASEGQATRMTAPACKGTETCKIVLEGPEATLLARRANAEARYWQELFKHELSFVAAQPPLPAPPDGAIADAIAPSGTEAESDDKAGAVPELPPVQPDEPMAEAGRKVMFTHFMKMLANEAGTRDGEDIEFLHDMRVATRRLRAAYRIFEPFYEVQGVRRFNKELRRAGAALGAVRDLDVLIEHAQAYEEALTPEEGLTLAPLLRAWVDKRAAARRDLLDYLDSKSYQQFVEDFRTFLLTPGLAAQKIPPGEPVAHQVRHVIPRLIMERYEVVRAYEGVLPDVPLTTYHALRIDCKRLRYALEFFAPLFGDDAPALIKQVIALQELLGATQDAHVAEGLIVEFLAENRGRKERKGNKSGGAARRDGLAGIEAYLLTQQHIQADLLGLFENPWHVLTSPDFRRSLGLALATP